MPTRSQAPQSAVFRPDAFASSPDFERGILGNQVAARCQLFTDPEEIAVHWWLQQISWREGGLSAFAEQFLAAYADRIGTPSMLRFGMKPGQIYNREQVIQIRTEIDASGIKDLFPLKGEPLPDHSREGWLDYLSDRATQSHAARDLRSACHPNCYPASAFQQVCCLDADDLLPYLKDALVNPAAKKLSTAFWNFPSLWECLVEYREREIEAARAGFVTTALSAQVWDELDYALESRGFILIEGREGIGKTEAARTWCAQHPGRAVYVRLESGTDEQTLYRSIARRIGTACSYGRKATEMRARIQDALQPGHLMLVIDEAHFLWPMSDRSERTAPKRVDWLRTALIDFGVPIALISTPQFFARQCERFRKSGWNSNQVERRLARTKTLPDSLGKEDLIAVARCYFPAAGLPQVKKIAGIALLTIGYLTTIANLRRRVDFFARRQPERPETELIEQALSEIAPPPAEQPPAPSVQRPGKGLAGPVQRPCRTPATAPDRVRNQPAVPFSHTREQAALTTV
ncbi:MAG: ATP-binding protein [Opitutaceae bacterium]|nr:ATP-binding protein [Opitutaceae bacterium]